MSSVKAPLARRLRTETRIAHERVEQAFDLPTAAREMNTYIAVLLRMRCVYQVLCQELGRHSGETDGEAERAAKSRYALLGEDLAALGWAAGPCPSLSLALANANEVLGCEYVIRGSALGGTVILKLANTHLNVTEQRGGKFFHGDGDATGANWSKFQQKLAGSDAASRTADEVVAGAFKTFGLFQAVLSDPPLPENG